MCASANSTSYHIKHTFFSRYEHGVTGVLEEISNIDEKEEGNCVVVFVLLLKSVTRTGLHFSGYFSLCLFYIVDKGIMRKITVSFMITLG